MKTKTLGAALISLAMLVAGCSSGSSSSSSGTSSASVKAFAKVDNTAWSYHSGDDVYYQIGLTYCENPADTTYETAGIFVPGAYMSASDNGDGTYTCEVNTSGRVNGYTADTAPIVIPVNTPGYSALSAPTQYQSSCATYTASGFIYYNPGCRGRDHGAPAGVTDLKAAVRYYRYNAGEIPGSTDRIFTFGHSGGGAQSALMGASGDNDLYTPYLEAIGAVSDVSDSICGAMCWCPITNLDEADAAYEWNMGSTRTGLSDDDQAVSDALAESYVSYINNAGFVDGGGKTLTLDSTTSGSYYDEIKRVIETSLENFLQDTSFPYDASSSSSSNDGPPGGGPNDNVSRDENASSSSSLDLSGSYDTASDYVDALNAEKEWVTYDSASGDVTVSDIATFVSYFKGASKNLGAFDQYDKSQAENVLFGDGSGNGAHFDSTLSSILETLGSDYASDYAADLKATDTLGTDTETRVSMYTPLCYLLKSEEGYQTSTVASYWRIRTGIEQGDTSLSTETNLALALEAYEDVKSVDFASVWGQGHTEAERTGSASDNFISWINEICETL